MSDTNELAERLIALAWDAARSSDLAQRQTHMAELRQQLEAALAPVEAVPVVKPGELPDDMRVPLHSLQADLDWLVARIRAEDDEGVGMCKDSIRSRLSQIEEAAYRLNHAALAHPPAQAGAVTEAMVEAMVASISRQTKKRNGYVGQCDTRKVRIDGEFIPRAALTAALGAQTPPEGVVTEAWTDEQIGRFTEALCAEDPGDPIRCSAPKLEALARHVLDYVFRAPTPPVNQSEGADRG